VWIYWRQGNRATESQPFWKINASLETYIGEEDFDLLVSSEIRGLLAHINTSSQEVGNLEQRDAVGNMSWASA